MIQANNIKSLFFASLFIIMIQRRLFSLILLILVSIAVCSCRLVQSGPTLVNRIEPTSIPASATPMLTITSSRTTVPPTMTLRVPTATPSLLPTDTSTPIPSVPPFYLTPTFDTSTIVTVTKSPNSTCPETNPKFQPIIPDQGDVEAGNYPDSQITLQNAILESLNQGATLAALQSAIIKATGNGNPLGIKANAIYPKELTGDIVPEVVFSSFYRFSIFTCINGYYVLGLDMPSGALFGVDQPSFEDLNRDHLPEVVVSVHDYVSVVPYLYLFVFRWNGEAFQDLILADHGYDFYLPETKSFSFCCTREYEFQDIDRNGLKEIVVQEEVGHHADDALHGPWRDIIETVAWNGAAFSLLPEQLTPAVYRFQAAQDGDRTLQRWDFEEALKLYQRVLDDKKLKGWSKDQYQQMQYSVEAQWHGEPTPLPLPDDNSDYPALTAYARFKILLIHVAQGKVDQARDEYEHLQKDFPQGQSGSGFARMAKEFWDEYSSGHGLAAGCARAQEYADAHTAETSDQIDANWHGWQSPELDMCPF